MANSINAMIAAYRAGELDPQGESHVKCAVVGGLEEHLEEPKALAFLLDLIGDPDEYDLARVDALKILQVYEPGSERVRRRVGRRLAKVLLAETDVLVQQWVAIAAGNFMSVPQVYAAVSVLLADGKSESGVRHNCLAALLRLGPSPRTRGPLEVLVADPQLGAQVRRILEEWGPSS